MQSAKIANFIRISQIKTPNLYKKWGFYNSTMAISTGFTVGFNVKESFFSIRHAI